jgi:hypothetical protein
MLTFMMLQSYCVDVHKGYSQNISNEKALEVLKRTPMTNKILKVHKRTSMTNKASEVHKRTLMIN